MIFLAIIFSFSSCFCNFSPHPNDWKRMSRKVSISRTAGNRMLHAMLHVKDIDESLNFYQDLGMKVLSCNRRPDGAATAFVGFGTLRDMENFALELSAQKRSEKENAGINLGSFQGLTVSQLEAPDSDSRTDPDGYPIQIRQQKQAAILGLCLNTRDLKASTTLYTQKLGMSVVEGPAGGESVGKDACYLKYPSGAETYLCLRQSEVPIELGTGFDHLVIATADVEAAAEQLQQKGVKIALPPTVMFGLKITGVVDDDGYKIYLVDESDFQKGL